MIKVTPAPEPPSFDQEVRRRGVQWLRDHPEADRPRDFWSSACKAELADAFGGRCAYSAMYEPVGTVDHFVSFDEDPSLAYEWSNFRYAAQWINSSKQHLPASSLLDPFGVEDGWFVLLLPSLQLVVSDTIPAAQRAKAEFVLERLHLRDDERVLRQRRAWMSLYEQGQITLDGLDRMAPLIARALRAASERGASLTLPMR